MSQWPERYYARRQLRMHLWNMVSVWFKRGSFYTLKERRRISWEHMTLVPQTLQRLITGKRRPRKSGGGGMNFAKVSDHE